MKWHRIQALIFRYLYLYPRSVPRILDIFFWPITDLLIWGFLTLYLSQINVGAMNFVNVLLGALVFWNFIHRSQQAVSISFLEEIWEKNLLNIFVTPITIWEFLTATVFVGVVRLALIGTIISLFAFLFFKFNIFLFGFYLIPFAINLFLFGWILGLIATSIILRFGQSAQVLAFALTILLQPFVAVFYPVEVLPSFLQPISLSIPVTHVFEGMRSIVIFGSFSVQELVIATLLNFVWLGFSLFLFLRMFDHVREKGRLAKLMD